VLSYTTVRSRRDRRLRHRNFLAEALLLAYWPAETFFKSIVTRYPYQFTVTQVNPGAHRFPFYNYIQTRPHNASETRADRPVAPLTPLENAVSISVPGASDASEFTVFVKYSAIALAHFVPVSKDPIPPLEITLPVGILRLHTPSEQVIEQKFLLGATTYDLAVLDGWQWARFHFSSSGVTVTQYSDYREASANTTIATGWGSNLPTVAGWVYKARSDYTYGLFDPPHSDHFLGGIFSFYGDISFEDFWRFFYNAERTRSGTAHSASHLFISYPLIQTQVAFESDIRSAGYFRQPQRIWTGALTDSSRFSCPVNAMTQGWIQPFVDTLVDGIAILPASVFGDGHSLTGSEIAVFAPANSTGEFVAAIDASVSTRQFLGIQGIIVPSTHVLAQITNPIILRSFGSLEVHVVPAAAGISRQPLRILDQFDVRPFATFIPLTGIGGSVFFVSRTDGQAAAKARQLLSGQTTHEITAHFGLGGRAPLRGLGAPFLPVAAENRTQVVVRGQLRPSVDTYASSTFIAAAHCVGRAFPDLASNLTTSIPVFCVGQITPTVEAMILFNITTMHFGQFPELGRPINKLVVDFFIG